MEEEEEEEEEADTSTCEQRKGVPSTEELLEPEKKNIISIKLTKENRQPRPSASDRCALLVCFFRFC